MASTVVSVLPKTTTRFRYTAPLPLTKPTESIPSTLSAFRLVAFRTCTHCDRGLAGGDVEAECGCVRATAGVRHDKRLVVERGIEPCLRRRDVVRFSKDQALPVGSDPIRRARRTVREARTSIAGDGLRIMASLSSVRPVAPGRVGQRAIRRLPSEAEALVQEGKKLAVASEGTGTIRAGAFNGSAQGASRVSSSEAGQSLTTNVFTARLSEPACELP